MPIMHTAQVQRVQGRLGRMASDSHTHRVGNARDVRLGRGSGSLRIESVSAASMSGVQDRVSVRGVTRARLRAKS